MPHTISRRALLATALAPATLAATHTAAHAATLPVPAEPPILTVTGRIANTNEPGAARFDRPMLEALGLTTIETATPWYTGPVRFEGVRMDTLMHHVGATGSTVTAIALNDFTSTIPVSDFARYGVLLALKRDGAYMPVRDKGPLFVVYPYDSDPELRAQKYYSRSAWQLAQLIVQ